MRKYVIYPFIGIAIILQLCLLYRRLCSGMKLLREFVKSYVGIRMHTLVGPKNFLKDFEPINSDGTINVVIEIPAGTAAKWEVDKKDGSLKWEFKEGKPRIVKYLGYPGNYGMVPQTLLSKELGGDGDPLDVLVLGKMVPRGSVVDAKLIGILKFLDGGEQDDKLLAVLPGTPFF